MNEISYTNRKTFTYNTPATEPGSAAESIAFTDIQSGINNQFQNIFPDKLAPRTVVILPSLSLDQDILSKIKGSVHYEERMLCLLMLLRMPLTKLVFITSIPIPDIIIDYYLHLMPGITGHHARQRLTMLSCYDAAAKPLTQKILERPRVIERIKQLISDPASAHLTCYNITSLEKTLAVQLGIPLFGTDPAMFYEGSKSGSRKNFRDCGVSLPDGYEDLSTQKEIVTSLAALKRKHPQMRKAVIKMNDGFSGDGNAIYHYRELAINTLLEKNIEQSLMEETTTVAKDLSIDIFFEKFQQMGGIVEEFLEGEIKMSPSVQCVITPTKQIDIVSTHDQLLGGEDGQVFMGAVFPADGAYSISLAIDGEKIARNLMAKGALGRFAIDFISVKQSDGTWKNYAIEINLRKGGTTHPLLMLQFLTDGSYDADKGEYLTPAGNRRFYFASDNVTSPLYIGLTPEDLLDISMFHELTYDGATQEGVMFHLIGALSAYGKLGVVCVGGTPEKAKAYYDKTIRILDFECSLEK